MFKQKKLALTLMLALLGASYFGALSSLEVNFVLKSVAVLLPVQVGGSLYLLYLYWTGQIPGTLRHQQRQLETANSLSNSRKSKP